MNDTIFWALKFKWFSLAPLVLLYFFVFYPFMGKPQVFYWTIRTLVYPSSFLWLKCPKMGEKCHKSSRKFHPVCLTHKTFFMVFKKLKKKYLYRASSLCRYISIWSGWANASMERDIFRELLLPTQSNWRKTHHWIRNFFPFSNSKLSYFEQIFSSLGEIVE